MIRNNKWTIKAVLAMPVACTVCIGCGQDASEADGQEDRKPLNIIYIMSDDHSYQTIGAYGHGLIETPNIDRLADSGMIFTQSFVANSISGPSRACLLTGKHSHKNGFTDNTRTQVPAPGRLRDRRHRQVAPDLRPHRLRLLEHPHRTGPVLQPHLYR